MKLIKNPMTTTELLAAKIADALGDFGTESDFARGHKDVIVHTLDGEEHVVRVTVPSEMFRSRLVERYIATSDFRSIAPGMLEGKFRSPDFINQIIASDLSKLGVAALGLLVGPTKLRELIAWRGIGGIGGQIP